MAQLVSFPGSPPSLYIYMCGLIYAKLLFIAREGESLEGFDHMWILKTRSVSIVATYESPKEREKLPNQHASRLFGVLYRWLDRWTKLLVNILTPHAHESLRTIMIKSW